MYNPKTLQDAIKFYGNPDNCQAFMMARRWPDGKVTCPTCARDDVRYISTRRMWECKAIHAKRQFSVKVGTVMEDSPIALEKWLLAFWQLANCKNGISSYEIASAIGVTQKSAWFMMHRIRLAMKDKSGRKLGGGNDATEVDESFIGGKLKNMHRSRRLALNVLKHDGLPKNETKTLVAGLLDREAGKVRAEIIPNRERATLDSIVRNHVKFGSLVYTDDHIGYIGLRSRFTHEAINKKVEGYIRGRVHTNGIENFWSLLKRGLAGTYVSVEPMHLARYLDEQVFRYNNRKDGDRKKTAYERFELATSQILGRRLTYAELTGKVGVHEAN